MPNQNRTGRTFWDVIAETDAFYKWLIFITIVFVVCGYFHIAI